MIEKLKARLEETKATIVSKDAEIAGKAVSEGPLVDPVHLFLHIEEKLADDSILIVDGGAARLLHGEGSLPGRLGGRARVHADERKADGARHESTI